MLWLEVFPFNVEKESEGVFLITGRFAWKVSYKSLAYCCYKEHVSLLQLSSTEF